MRRVIRGPRKRRKRRPKRRRGGKLSRREKRGLQKGRKGPSFDKPTHPSHPHSPQHSVKATSAGASGPYTSGGASSGGAGGYNPQTIRPKDTLGDIYYKTYTEDERGNAPHRASWNLKQKGTFQELVPCRDWFLNSIPPGEVNRQRALTHDALYEAYVVGEANTLFAGHQIVREWSDWENYRQRLVRQVAELTAKVEDVQAAQAAKGQAEAKLAEVKVQLSSRDKDLIAKDVEIAELKRRLQEQVDKSESLEIDLEAEKVKAATAEEAKQKAEEARDISTTALNVAQNNYSEAQGIFDTLVSEAEWLRGRGLVLMANSILNVGELDKAVAALIDASRAVGHRGGYLECAQHATESFLYRSSTLVIAQ
ncbi:hypothetical protein Hdeb2414_s0026g00683301 [Helianthus debilis subsp. tardiflorus]